MIATKEIKIGVRAAIAIAMLAAAFVLPVQASADSCSSSDPTVAQYCSKEVVVEQPPATVIESPPASGSLPFTGLDVAALIAAAAVLTGTGLALRRISGSGRHEA